MKLNQKIIHPIEYSYGELLKRELCLSQNNQSISLQSIIEELYSAISAISLTDSIADVPEALILAMVSSQIIEFDSSEISIESHNGVMIFLGMLLAAYLDNNAIEVTAPLSDVDSEDLIEIKSHLDQIYTEKAEMNKQALLETNRILALSLYAFHERLVEDLKEQLNENNSITETESC